MAHSPTLVWLHAQQSHELTNYNTHWGEPCTTPVLTSTTSIPLNTEVLTVKQLIIRSWSTDTFLQGQRQPRRCTSIITIRITSSHLLHCIFISSWVWFTHACQASWIVTALVMHIHHSYFMNLISPCQHRPRTDNRRAHWIPNTRHNNMVTSCQTGLALEDSCKCLQNTTHYGTLLMW